MAEMIGVAAVGWVASPFVNKLLNSSMKYLSRDITKELKDLQTIVVPELELTIQAVRNSPDDEAKLIADWLGLLIDAFYDAENILNKLEYKSHQRTAQGKKDDKFWVRISSYPMIKPLAKFFIKKFLLLSKLGHRLKKFLKIAAKAKALRKLIIQTRKIKNGTISVNSQPTTSSLLPDDPIFGRDRDCEQITKHLLDTKNHSVVAITGVGGSGKTTLAQYVFNDARVIKHFGVKIWISNISLTQKLNIVEECTMNMIEFASKYSKGKFPNISKDSNLDTLHRTLQEILEPFKTILLVLDDVWYDEKAGEDGQWENLLKPFYFKKDRCKFLVTSRAQKFPSKLRTEIHIELSDLSDDAFLSLFRYFAFKGVENIDPRFSKIGDDIAKKIAKKMRKSPLAAKVIGNQLSKQKSDIDVWRKTLITVNISSIRQVLQWSYNRLDVPLQRCFLFCSMFEKGKRFLKMDLVRYWVALDFVQSSDDKIATVEEIGLEYLDKMVANSIFQLINERYIMHDLFHDLAIKLSAGDCLRVIDSEEVNAKDKIVHLFLRGNCETLKKNLSEISNLRNLRALVLAISPSIEDASEIFTIIAGAFKNLKVLGIECRGLKTLPSVVGNLKNLRHLTVWESSIEKLPDSTTELYHLQFLAIPNSVKNLPTKMSNLINLQNILTYKSNGIRAKILPPVPYLGKLTSLQSLDEFHVRKEEGYDVGQLGSLMEIGGSLRIVNLANVRDTEDAKKANLEDKTKIKELELLWGMSAESSSQVDVINALQPPKYLELLTIDGYSGSNYPRWLKKGSVLQDITQLCFKNCNVLSSLPPFQQFGNCSKLVLENLEALTELSTFPECLTTLRISKCPCLVLVSEKELQDVNQRNIMKTEFLRRDFEFNKNLFDHELKSFKHTRSLQNCPQEFQNIQSALQVDDNVMRAWWSCHKQRMNFIFSNTTRASKLILPTSKLRILELRYCCISDGALSDCLAGMFAPALQELHLEGIMTITTLPPAPVLKKLAVLNVLEIKHCWCLTSLGGLYALPPFGQFRVRKDVLAAIFVPQSPCRRPLERVGLDSATVNHLRRGGRWRHIGYDGTQFPFPHTYNQLEGGSMPSRRRPNNLHQKIRPFINDLSLVLLPNLTNFNGDYGLMCLEGCQRLNISSLPMLNKFLSSRDIVFPPQILEICYCQEEVITFEKVDHLRSIHTLRFTNCKTKNLPASLSDFSSLVNIIFTDCPEISKLPALPNTIQYMEISGCPVLKGRCQPDGPDWQKIQHIKTKEIQ